MKDKIENYLTVVKRSGQRVAFNGTKIAIAIKSSFDDLYETYDENKVNFIYNDVINHISSEYENRKTINVEDIQDIIENKLKKHGFDEVYENFKGYRERRRASRETFQNKVQHKFVKVIEDVSSVMQNAKNTKPYSSSLNYGKAIAKEYTRSYLIDNKYNRLHDDGSLYIHNLDILSSATIDDYHIDLTSIKEDKISKYTSLIKEVLLNIKKDVSGVINIPNIDSLYNVVIVNNFRLELKKLLRKYLTLEGFEEYFNFKKLDDVIDKINSNINIDIKIFEAFINNRKIEDIFEFAINNAYENIVDILKENIESLLNSLNNNKTYLKNSDYSLSVDTFDLENNLFTKLVLEYLENNEYLDHVSVVFKINDKSVFAKLMMVLNKNIYFLKTNDADLDYFVNGKRVYENYWQDACSLGKSINAKVTINLPRIGIKSSTEEEYFANLEEILDLGKNTLLQIFELVANKYKDNFEYLFNSDIFANIDLEENQKIRKIIKNGVLSLGFVGLHESVIAFKKKSDITFTYKVLKFMKEKCEEYTNDEKLNIVLTNIDERFVASEFLKIDKSVYGNMLNITDKKYYTFLPESYEDDYDIVKKVLNIVNSGYVYKLYLPKRYSNKKCLELLETTYDNVIFFKVIDGKEEL